RGGVRRDGIRSDPPAIAGLDAFHPPSALCLGPKVGESLTVFRDKRIEIDDLGNMLRRAVGDAGRDHAAIAMADQHDIAKVLELQDAEYVLDMGIEVIIRAR